MRAPRLTAALAAVPIVLAGVAGVAHADNIQDTIEGSVPGLTLEAGSATAAGAAIRLVGNNADGATTDPGCNIDAGEAPLVLDVVTPAGITATPDPLTVSQCGTEYPVSFVAGSTAQSGTVTVTVVSGPAGGGGYNNQVLIPITVTQPVVSNTPPGVSIVGVTDGASYAVGSVPPATCSVVDAEDGPSTFPATLGAVTGPYASDGIGSQTATCSATDLGGLQASASATYSILDPSAPTIAATLTPAVPDGENGWYRGDVTLRWDVVEDESPSSLVETGCVDQDITADQASTGYSCAATSAGGAADEQTVTVQRDGTPPTTPTFVGGPPASFAYDGQPLSAPTCVSTDATSGLLSCVVSGGGQTTVGVHSYLATATDLAGNTSTASYSYEVLAWGLAGFRSPVDMGAGVWNSVKGGSTVPLKFEVFAGQTELTSTSAVRSFTVRTVACPGSTAQVDEIELVTTGGTSLRYDTTGGQFVQNWQTPKKPGTCYAVTMTTQDASTLSANFLLR